MYKLIIAGSRGWNDYPALINAMADFTQHYKITQPIQIVSGTARGADQLGEHLAKEYGLSLVRMPAEWDRFGRSAGYKRNERMAHYADGCIVLWDGQSRGSIHMHNLAKTYNLQRMLVSYK